MTGTPPQPGAAAGGMVPGEILPAEGTITLNAGADPITLVVVNTGDRPVQVGSHFHLAQANAALSFDRTAAHGRRLDIPAGTAVRFEPGVERTVSLVPLRGARVVPGLTLSAPGALDAPTVSALGTPAPGSPDAPTSGEPSEAG